MDMNKNVMRPIGNDQVAMLLKAQGQNVCKSSIIPSSINGNPKSAVAVSSDNIPPENQPKYSSAMKFDMYKQKEQSQGVQPFCKKVESCTKLANQVNNLHQTESKVSDVKNDLVKAGESKMKNLTKSVMFSTKTRKSLITSSSQTPTTSSNSSAPRFKSKCLTERSSEAPRRNETYLSKNVTQCLTSVNGHQVIQRPQIPMLPSSSRGTNGNKQAAVTAAQVSNKAEMHQSDKTYVTSAININQHIFPQQVITRVAMSNPQIINDYSLSSSLNTILSKLHSEKKDRKPKLRTSVNQDSARIKIRTSKANDFSSKKVEDINVIQSLQMCSVSSTFTIAKPPLLAEKVKQTETTDYYGVPKLSTKAEGNQDTLDKASLPENVIVKQCKPNTAKNDIETSDQVRQALLAIGETNEQTQQRHFAKNCIKDSISKSNATSDSLGCVCQINESLASQLTLSESVANILSVCTCSLLPVQHIMDSSLNEKSNKSHVLSNIQMTKHNLPRPRVDNKSRLDNEIENAYKEEIVSPLVTSRLVNNNGNVNKEEILSPHLSGSTISNGLYVSKSPQSSNSGLRPQNLSADLKACASEHRMQPVDGADHKNQITIKREMSDAAEDAYVSPKFGIISNSQVDFLSRSECQKDQNQKLERNYTKNSVRKSREKGHQISDSFSVAKALSLDTPVSLQNKNVQIIVPSKEFINVNRTFENNNSNLIKSRKNVVKPEIMQAVKEKNRRKSPIIVIKDDLPKNSAPLKVNEGVNCGSQVVLNSCQQILSTIAPLFKAAVADIICSTTSSTSVSHQTVTTVHSLQDNLKVSTKKYFDKSVSAVQRNVLLTSISSDISSKDPEIKIIKPNSIDTAISISKGSVKHGNKKSLQTSTSKSLFPRDNKKLTCVQHTKEKSHKIVQPKSPVYVLAKTFSSPTTPPKTLIQSTISSNMSSATGSPLFQSYQYLKVVPMSKAGSKITLSNPTTTVYMLINPSTQTVDSQRQIFLQTVAVQQPLEKKNTKVDQGMATERVDTIKTPLPSVLSSKLIISNALTSSSPVSSNLNLPVNATGVINPKIQISSSQSTSTHPTQDLKINQEATNISSSVSEKDHSPVSCFSSSTKLSLNMPPLSKINIASANLDTFASLSNLTSFNQHPKSKISLPSSEGKANSSSGYDISLVNLVNFSVPPSQCHNYCTTIPKSLSISHSNDQNSTRKSEIGKKLGSAKQWSSKFVEPKLGVPVQKKLYPIRCKGAARVNGLLPYTRVTSVIYDPNGTIVSNKNNDLPVIAEVKSLAKMDKKILEKEDVHTTASADSNIKLDIDYDVDNICSASDELFNVAVISKSGDSIGATTISKRNAKNTVTDTIGIVRVDTKNTEPSSMNTADVTRTKRNNVCTYPNKVVFGEVRRSKRYSKNITSTDESYFNEHQNHFQDPKLANEISRTVFALERLFQTTRKRTLANSKLTLIMKSLRELKSELENQRSKQKYYMIGLSKGLKEAEQKKLETPAEVGLSPAQRLMQKFSLKKVTSSAVALSNETKTEETQNSIKQMEPPKTVVKKPKTFKEILEEQRKRKQQRMLLEGIAKPKSPDKHLKKNPKSPKNEKSPNLLKTDKKEETSPEITAKPTLRKKFSPTTLSPDKGSHHLKLQKPSAEQRAAKPITQITQKHDPLAEKYDSKSVLSSPNQSATGSVRKEEKNLKVLDWEDSYFRGKRRTCTRRFNPKDPFNSLNKSNEEADIQKAIELSLRTAENERKRVLEEQQSLAAVRPDMKKRRFNREVAQLTDTHWNESGLRADCRSPTESRNGTSREERKLHYALARIAEMEYQAEMRASLKSPPPVKRVKVEPQRKESPGKKTRTASVTEKSKGAGKKNILASIKSNYRNKSVLKTNQKNKLLKKAKENIVRANIKRSNENKSVIASKKENKIDESKQDKARSYKSNDPKKLSATKKTERKGENSGITRKVAIPEPDKSKKRVISGQQSRKHECAKNSNHDTDGNTKTTIKKLNVNRAAGETELHKAARLGYADMVEQRILEGANVDERDNAGWSALHEACAYGKINIVELLLRHGANPNCCSNSGIRPLHDACEKGHVEIIRLLLAFGADHTIVTYAGFLPVDCILDNKLKEYFKACISDIEASEMGANISQRGWEFQNSYSLQGQKHHLDIFKDIPTDPMFSAACFQTGNNEMPQTYYLPYKNEEGVIIGCRNYYRLKDLLDRLGCSRDSFLSKGCQIELKKIKLSEFHKLMDTSCNTLPSSLPSYSAKNRKKEVELVSMGRSTFGKLFNLKMKRFDR